MRVLQLNVPFVFKYWLVYQNFGVRYDVEVNPKVLGTDPDNVAPRVAFAWSPGSGRKMVIRADWTISPILQYNSARPFNILTGFDNYGDNYLNNHRVGAGRNIGIGPDFVSADLRASRKFVFDAKKRWNLEVIAEGFNLANRTNFRTVNQVVGDVPLQSLPNPIRAFRGTPDQPLAYTSAFEPRQFQFGVKINY